VSNSNPDSPRLVLRTVSKPNVQCAAGRLEKNEDLTMLDKNENMSISSFFTRMNVRTYLMVGKHKVSLRESKLR
jgi:hypothetical protein